ncbi:unnamed protein product [Brassicogethes aeneus]|uniref:TsaA-like domain-containing protein n=1 Tax=Brassicogethes aeneus TaxID=1431903 RepID=A0A9P0FF35_BRAAE|nr:unnamed protein product [Brassicogethes aeneus]
MSGNWAEQTNDASYLQKQLEIARREINNLRQQITSLNHVHKKECDSIYDKLKTWQCMECRSKQNNTNSNTNITYNQNDFKCNYIGKITTQFPEKRGTPRQPGICSEMVAKLTLNSEVFTNPNHALEGLQEFSHMWILFHFHKNDSNHVKAKVAPPRLNGVRTGVFATRSPHRPCPIGLSLVKIDRIFENVVYFSGVDMINDTPVLDIKPYIPQYDSPSFCNNVSISENDDTYITRDLPSTSGANLSITRVLDGEENKVTQSGTHINLEETIFARSTSRIGEREAPDGEEEENPINIPPMNVSENEIRIPAWINQPPVSRLNVLFKERALLQLAELGEEGEEKKTTIMNVLREDPRSIYLRERWGSHCYVFRIADLCVSCKFNDANFTVTVFQVFENEASTSNE